MRPVLSRPWWVHLSDFGAGNPDAIYHTAALRDDVTYRISGTCGNAEFLSFELFAGAAQAGSIAKDDLAADAAGQFEIMFGPTERAGNWLEVVPGTSSLLTREFFGDWASARPGRYQIECLDPAPLDWPPLSADRVEREIRALGDWLVSTVEIFTGAQLKGLAGSRNAFRAEDPRPDSGLPSIYHGFWDLAEDECLVIDAAPPPGDYWSVQLANGLWNTLDCANRQSSLNLAQVEREPDGSIRIVLAHRDPGAANWLDTIGHRTGALTLRFTRAGAKPPAADRTDAGRDAGRLDVRLGHRGAAAPGRSGVPRPDHPRREARGGRGDVARRTADQRRRPPCGDRAPDRADHPDVGRTAGVPEEEGRVVSGLCEGRVVVVTGAGGGIGREYALAFARNGARVVVNDLGGSRDGSGGSTGAAQAVVDEIVAAGGQAVANVDNVASWDGAKNLISQATETYDGLDVLVNNAGILRDKMLVNMD